VLICFPTFATCCCCEFEFVSLLVQCLMERKPTSFVAILRRLGLLQSWVNIRGQPVKSVSKDEETESEENHPCKSGAQPPPPPPPSEVKFEISCTSQVSDVASTIDTFRVFLFFVFNPYLCFLSLTRSSGFRIQCYTPWRPTTIPYPQILSSSFARS
jgi:hypothetical protein